MTICYPTNPSNFTCNWDNKTKSIPSPILATYIIEIDRSSEESVAASIGVPGYA